MAKNSQYHFYVLFIIRRGYTGSLQFLWSFLLKQFGKWCIEARNICRSLISFNLQISFTTGHSFPNRFSKVCETFKQRPCDGELSSFPLPPDFVLFETLSEIFFTILWWLTMKIYFLQDVLQLIEGVHVIHQHPCLPPIPPKIHLLLLFHLISRPHSKGIDRSSWHGDMELGESSTNIILS